VQRFGNASVLQSLTDEVDHLAFARGQRGNFVCFRIGSVAWMEQVSQNPLSDGAFKPDAASSDFANRNRNLLNGPLSLNHALGAATQRPFKEIRILSARQYDHPRFINLCDKTFQCIKFFLQDVGADEQNIG
jgi:hypothetical protein